MGGPYSKDYSNSVSTLGSPYLGKIAYMGCRGLRVDSFKDA